MKCLDCSDFPAPPFRPFLTIICFPKSQRPSQRFFRADLGRGYHHHRRRNRRCPGQERFGRPKLPGAPKGHDHVTRTEFHQGLDAMRDRMDATIASFCRQSTPRAPRSKNASTLWNPPWRGWTSAQKVLRASPDPMPSSPIKILKSKI